MIIDRIENLDKYVKLNPLFQVVCDYIKQNDPFSHPLGKTELKGKDVVANFCCVAGKEKPQARLETHDLMIDIQMPLSTPEVYGFTPRLSLPEAEYNEAKDITFYAGEAETYFTLTPGEFAIFFPEDGHAPGIADAAELNKVIFKVKA